MKINWVLTIDNIDSAKTRWTSQIFLVAEINRPFFICIDSHNINNMKTVTVWYWFPIVHVDKCINSFGDKTVFSILEANSEHRQINIAEKDWPKIAITSSQNLSNFTCLLSKLKNVPETSQRKVDVPLRIFKWQVALIYSDDVVMFLQTFDKDIDHGRALLPLLYSAGVTLNLK